MSQAIAAGRMHCADAGAPTCATAYHHRMFMNRLYQICILWSALLLTTAACADKNSSAPVIVAAASDLHFVLEEIATNFERDGSGKVSINTGSSGNLSRQMLQGAPFELFMSADEEYVFQLMNAGLTADSGVLYGVGRLVLFLPTNSPLALDAELRSIRANWGSVNHFAIANWEHAPYGRAAREVLMNLDMWELVQPKLVLGENVSQAAQFVTSRAAEAGIIALSIALSPEVSALGNHSIIPESLHSPLLQRMVLSAKAGPQARRFYEYLQQPASRQIFRRYGFTLPGETE